MGILLPVITMGILSLIFAVGLVFAYKKLQVEIDPRVEKINESLPQANCGACGLPGCQAMSEAMVLGTAVPTACPVCGEDRTRKIAEILGVSVGELFKKVARIHCRGTWKAARLKGAYQGLLTCQASHLIGGNKQCSYSCISLGDCVRICPFEAMEMGDDGIPIVNEVRCTACGKCVQVCPRNIIELCPTTQEVLVFCRSLNRGAVAKKTCENACIACGICAKEFPEAIVVENNLAKITDVSKIESDKISQLEKCPTSSIGKIRRFP